MADIERLPWLEHERLHRLREGELAKRSVEPDESWSLPKPVAGPEPTSIADPDGIGPIARLRRAALNQCILCSRPLARIETEMRESTCVDCTQQKRG